MKLLKQICLLNTWCDVDVDLCGFQVTGHGYAYAVSSSQQVRDKRSQSYVRNALAKNAQTGVRLYRPNRKRNNFYGFTTSSKVLETGKILSSFKLIIRDLSFTEEGVVFI